MFKRQREFVADASHELRTPLTVMGIAAEGMEGDTDSNFSEFTVDTLKTMRIEIKRMNNLVAALLSLARNDAGAGDLKLEQVNFNVLFEQTLGTLSMLAEQKGLKLEQRLAQERLIIWGDRMRLEQLLTILVDNAIKYSARGRSQSVHCGKTASLLSWSRMKALALIPKISSGFLKDFTGSIKQGRVLKAVLA